MEACSLHSATLTTIPSSLSQNGFIDKTSLRGQVLKVSSSKRFPHVRKLGFFPINAQASGSTNFSSKIVKENSAKVDLKDENVAFVAGATGKVGSRAVRELLKLGFQVRAGVRSSQRAETLVQSVKQMKLESGSPSQGSQPVEKLEIVECDLEKQDQIGPALGNASVVLCCIGASEKEIFDVTGPYRIDYLATKNLIEAATVAKVNHFILLTSLGTSKIGFPAAILNLFWGVLYWKRKAEEALIASGLPYTIVRPGGMERPTDAYKETHNITLSTEDTLFGGQVSNLQVAELMACMAKNSDLSYFKVVEVVAETTAPLTPIEELLAKIPSQRSGIYSPKKFVSATTASDPEPSKSAAIEKPSTPSEEEPEKAVVLTKHSSSPYIAYEDLKPPTSPTPAPPRNTVKKASDIDTMPVAPAANPSQEESKTISDVKTSIERAQNSDHCHSPYPAYDNFKPPSSPSPSPPSPSLLSTPAAGNGAQPGPLLVNITVELPTEDTQSVKEQHTEPKPQPQSPFTMYEDLKPPASPMPSFKQS